MGGGKAGGASIFKRMRLPERLPPLTGWAMTIYVALWLALLPIAVAAPVAGSWIRYSDGAGDSRTANPLGFGNEHWVIDRVFGTEAIAAGLRGGERILAVDGIGVNNDTASTGEDPAERRLRVPEGAPVHLRVSSGKGPPRDITLHHRAATAERFFRGSGWTPDSLSLASALVPVVPWLVLVGGAVLLLGRRRDPGAALFSLTFLLLAHSVSWSSLAWRHVGLPVNLFGPFAMTGLLWSFLAFPRSRFEPRWTAWVAVWVPVDMALATFAGLPEALGNAIDLATVALVVAGLVVRHWREQPGDRRQWRWALLGFAFGMAAILLGAFVYSPYLKAHSDDTVVALWSWIITPGAAALGITLMIGGVLLSALRYRIYAAQSAVSRSLVYGTLTLALLAVFAGTEKIVELVGEEWFGQSLGALAGGLGAAFAAVAIAPLHKHISAWTEERLRKELIFLRRQLPRQLAEQAGDDTPEQVAQTALARIAGVLHAERGAILLGNRVLARQGIDEEQAAELPEGPDRGASLAVDRRDPLLPVRLPLGAHGRLVLGRKPDGSLYDKDERQALAEIAEPLGRALRHAARERSREARLAGVEEQIARLAASLRPSAA